jgi:hypothetical protein
MRHFILLPLVLLTCSYKLFAQSFTFADTANFWLNELKAATKVNQSLWNKDLYSPILLVNPVDRKVYANEPDSVGILKKQGPIFYGSLPTSVNISNTALEWGGKRWAMVMLPMPEEKANRLNLLTHELFHRAQPELGFVAYNPNNPHLDTRDGRIYLRMELEALKKAIAATDMKRRLQHVRYAIIYRLERFQKFPGSDTTENQLELNEGICEFNGLLMSGRSDSEIREHLTTRIDQFTLSPSFVRSFAYETTPVYGWLLSSIDRGWNQRINASTDLTQFFIKAFGLQIDRPTIDQEAWQATPLYNGEEISRQETERETARQLLLNQYKKQFVESVHLKLPLINMNMSFDYTKMVVLEPYGTVYPVIRITDKWGTLEASKGVLISNKWDSATVSLPLQTAGNKISGDGWTLELNPGYTIEKDDVSNKFTVKPFLHP